MAKSNSQRTKEFNDRQKAKGLIHAKVWVHPEESARVRKYAAKLPLTKEALKK